MNGGCNMPRSCHALQPKVVSEWCIYYIPHVGLTPFEQVSIEASWREGKVKGKATWASHPDSSRGSSRTTIMHSSFANLRYQFCKIQDFISQPTHLLLSINIGSASETKHASIYIHACMAAMSQRYIAIRYMQLSLIGPYVKFHACIERWHIYPTNSRQEQVGVVVLTLPIWIRFPWKCWNGKKQQQNSQLKVPLYQLHPPVCHQMSDETNTRFFRGKGALHLQSVCQDMLNPVLLAVLQLQFQKPQAMNLRTSGARMCPRRGADHYWQF